MADAAAAPKKKSKLLLIIILVVVLLLVAGGGAVAFLMMNQKKAAAPGHEAEVAEEVEEPKAQRSLVFAPLELFTTNLADPGRERYVQVGVSLEVVDAPTADSIKKAAPVIRSQVLLLLSSKTAEQLQSVEGKKELADKILAIARGVASGPGRNKGVLAVHFTSFVIQ